jgi:hypothetical protein
MSAIEETRGHEGLPHGFLELPSLVYATDPHWIPEEPAQVAAAFAPENPWFERGRALALAIPGTARLGAFFDPALRVAGRPAAFFGYWESVGDTAGDAALHARVAEWARRQGALELHGPINFSTYGNYRLRTSAEPGALPFPGEPYNPAAYPAALERLGYTVVETYRTQVSAVGGAAAVREARRRAATRAAASGYRIERLTPEIWHARLAEMHGLTDAIFGGNFAYTPLPFSAFARACGDAFIRRTCPLASMIAYGPEGDVAGLFLVAPHYGPLVVQAAGSRRVPVSQLSYGQHAALLASSGYRAAVLKTVGVAPRHRRRGVLEALTLAALAGGAAHYDHWLGALMRSDNPSGRVAAGLVSLERRYALYVRSVA